MDGTLLGHHDYRFEVTLPLIDQIRSMGAPLVLSTSKTLTEVRQWQNRLGIDDPFIVENGSAVVFPDEREEVLGVHLSELESFLEDYSDSITSLVSCSRDEAVKLTGLAPEEAAQAQDRQYSIPFKLHQPELETTIRAEASARNLRIIKGGRFLHLQGNCDKAQAAAIVRRRYVSEEGGVWLAIALGDNDNDRTMLESADIAVVVRTDQGHQLELSNRRTIYTTKTAPEGWCEGMTRALADLPSNLMAAE